MTGGLLQLVSIGYQDTYLIKNPKITFFKSVYRRHVNFYKFEENMYPSGDPGFNKKMRFPINHIGDLLRRMYLVIKLPKLKATSHAKSYTIENTIDKKTYYHNIVLYIVSFTFKRHICRYKDNINIANNINYLHNLKYYACTSHTDINKFYKFDKCKTDDEYIEDYISQFYFLKSFITKTNSYMEVTNNSIEYLNNNKIITFNENSYFKYKVDKYIDEFKQSIFDNIMINKINLYGMLCSIKRLFDICTTKEKLDDIFDSLMDMAETIIIPSPFISYINDIKTLLNYKEEILVPEYLTLIRVNEYYYKEEQIFKKKVLNPKFGQSYAEVILDTSIIDSYIEKIKSTYQYYKKYEKKLLEFKSEYLFYNKDLLYDQIIKDYNFGNLESSIRVITDDIVKDLIIVEDHDIIKNMKELDPIIDLSNLDLDKFITCCYVEKQEHIIIEKGKVSWVPDLGHKIIKNIQFLLNGQMIDNQDSNIFDITTNLTLNSTKIIGYNKMIGNVEELFIPKNKINPYDLIIPLNFWFNKDMTNCLPIFSLNNTDIEVLLVLKNIDRLIVGKSKNSVNIKTHIICEFINIDDNEKVRLGKNMEYIIEIYQKQVTIYNNKVIRLYFKHMIKELFWITKDKNNCLITKSKVEIQLNGITREEGKDSFFYNYLQPYYYHTSDLKPGYNMYSFSLYPEKDMLSGELNGSELLEIDLAIEGCNIYKVVSYAVANNILRVQGGFAILQYI